jgi:hypothetical protein
VAALAVYAGDGGAGGDGAPCIGDTGTHGRGAEADADHPAHPVPDGDGRRAHGDGRETHGDG